MATVWPRRTEVFGSVRSGIWAAEIGRGRQFPRALLGGKLRQLAELQKRYTSARLPRCWTFRATGMGWQPRLSGLQPFRGKLLPCRLRIPRSIYRLAIPLVGIWRFLAILRRQNAGVVPCFWAVP